MRISDWSSDVCSSDLDQFLPFPRREHAPPRAPWPTCDGPRNIRRPYPLLGKVAVPPIWCRRPHPSKEKESWQTQSKDRKSVVEGKSVSVRVELGGRRILKQKTKQQQKKNDITY